MKIKIEDHLLFRTDGRGLHETGPDIIDEERFTEGMGVLNGCPQPQRTNSLSETVKEIREKARKNNIPKD